MELYFQIYEYNINLHTPAGQRVPREYKCYLLSETKKRREMERGLTISLPGYVTLQIAGILCKEIKMCAFNKKQLVQ